VFYHVGYFIVHAAFVRIRLMIGRDG